MNQPETTAVAISNEIPTNGAKAVPDLGKAITEARKAEAACWGVILRYLATSNVGIVETYWKSVVEDYRHAIEERVRLETRAGG